MRRDSDGENEAQFILKFESQIWIMWQLKSQFHPQTHPQTDSAEASEVHRWKEELTVFYSERVLPSTAALCPLLTSKPHQFKHRFYPGTTLEARSVFVHKMLQKKEKILPFFSSWLPLTCSCLFLIVMSHSFFRVCWIMSCILTCHARLLASPCCHHVFWLRPVRL